MPMPPVTIAEILRRYANGARPADVVAETYARIRQVDDPGIFLHLASEADVLEQASRLPAFEPVRYPLWGVPCAVKDNIDVAGMPTTAACPAFAYQPDASAHAVQRLIDAGALIVGKTNLDQFATGLVGVRTPHAVPRNTFDAAHVPGGSSSGSAIAVAQGIVPFALGTDTAGSGRVPAGLNDLVGLKPSAGAISSRGMVPACRTLDCISVFARNVEDAFAVYAVMRGFDAADDFSRPVADDLPATAPPPRRIGIPDAASLMFFGDRGMEAAYRTAIARLRDQVDEIVEIDLQPFLAVAKLLYEGPWVAERHAAMRVFLEGHADDVHPVTRAIVANADKFSATDAFEGLYRLAALRRATEPTWKSVDALAVPTAPIFPTLADLAADPIGPNSRLGTYTNFVNLLDLAALAVPGPFRTDGLPAGVTFIGPRGSDASLARLGATFEMPAADRRNAAHAAAA